MKVPFMGKDHNHVSVGSWKGGFDHDELDEAWNSITDSAIDNPYLITVQGRWQRTAGVSAPEAPSWLLAGKTDIWIVGLGMPTLRREYNGSTDYGGGTVQLGAESGSTLRCGLRGLHLENNLGAASAGTGQAPEGALFVGKEENYPTSLTWDDLWIVGNLIDGSHDGLQIFGFHDPASATPGPSRPGRLHVQGNCIRSCHDAYTIKANIELHSSSNQIRVHSEGVGDIDNVEGWKHTGIHYNGSHGMPASGDRDPSQISFHDNETILVEVYGHTAVMYQHVAGLLQYSSGRGYRMQYSGGSIRVIFDVASSSNNIGGIRFGSGINLGADLAEFNGVNIDVDQRNASGPTMVAGALCDTTGSGAAFGIYNSKLKVANAAGTPYSLWTVNSTDTIYHGGCRSAQATNAGSGTLTRRTEL